MEEKCLEMILKKARMCFIKFIKNIPFVFSTSKSSRIKMENRVIRNLTYSGKILCNTIDTNISIYLIQHINVTQKSISSKSNNIKNVDNFSVTIPTILCFFLKNTTVSFSYYLLLSFHVSICVLKKTF